MIVKQAMCLLKYAFYGLLFSLLIQSSAMSLAFAQSNQERLFVSPFKNNSKQNIPDGEMILIENIFRTEASNNQLIVMTKDNIEALLPDGETLESCHSKSTCALDLGRRLQADYVITGELDYFSDQFHISIRLSRTSDMSMLSPLDLENKSLNALKDSLKREAGGLISKVNKNKILLFKQAHNLFISLSPIDATLYLNGVKLDLDALKRVTGGYLAAIAPGKNIITAKMNGFLEQSEEVFIANEGISNLEFKLQPSLKKDDSCATNSPECQGTIYIYSIPAGAEIWLDGQNTKQKTSPMLDNSNLGTYPITTTPGEHLVELRYPKHQNAPLVIQVKKGDFETELYKNNPIKLIPNFGKLILKTNPNSAIVKINGELKSNQTPYIEPELTAGYYEIIVEAKKYHPRKELVQIEKNKTLDLNWELKPDFSNVFINVFDATTKEPVFNANLLLNGTTYTSQESGKFNIGDLKKGKYNLFITHPLYEDINQEESIDDGGKSNVINIKLTPKYGTLSLSLQDQSTRYLAYIPTVPKPLPLPFDHLRLPAGNYSIKLIPQNKEGFEDELLKVVLAVGEYKKIEYQPKKKEGTLILNTNPFGAELYVNQEFKGRTPIKLKLIQGTYQIQINANNYDPYVDSIQVKEGEAIQKNIRLGQHPTFQIYCLPEGAEVWANGKTLGLSPQTFIEKPGLVELQCRFGDAWSEVKSFRSRSGQEERIHLEVDQSVIQALVSRKKSQGFWGKTLMWTGVGVFGLGASFQGLVSSAMDQRNQSYQDWLLSADRQGVDKYQLAIVDADQGAQQWNSASWITMGAGVLISSIGAMIYYSQPSLPTLQVQPLPKTEDFKRIFFEQSLEYIYSFDHKD